ncbi:MAG: hypothetical protein AB7Q29_16095 [Vicinamibacterales bacterium]
MKPPLLCRLGSHAVKRMETGRLVQFVPSCWVAPAVTAKVYVNVCTRPHCKERGPEYVLAPVTMPREVPS